MVAKRSKTQARRSAKRGGSSGFKWLVAGLLIGGAAFGYLHFKERWDRPATNLPTPDPQARVRNSGDDNGLADVPDKPRVKYDFYELLPGREVVIPDAELSTIVKLSPGSHCESGSKIIMMLFEICPVLNVSVPCFVT